MTAPGLITSATDWQAGRFAWLASVRRDAALSPTARLVAHVLVLDYANRHTLDCFPSLGEIGEGIGASKDTAKRAVSELVAAGWITRQIGRGRGNRTSYAFRRRAEIVPLKGGKSAPARAEKGANLPPFDGVQKGAGLPPFAGPEKGANLPRKGGKSAPRHNIANNHGNNHGAREGAAAFPKPSENPMVVREAERAVARFRDGRSDAFDGLPRFTIDHVIAADLLTPEERQRAALG